MPALKKKVPMLRLSIAMPFDGFEKIQKAAKAERVKYTVWCRDILLYAADQRLERKKKPRTTTKRRTAPSPSTSEA